jgi:hypothetical protein
MVEDISTEKSFETTFGFTGNEIKLALENIFVAKWDSPRTAA